MLQNRLNLKIIFFITLLTIIFFITYHNITISIGGDIFGELTSYINDVNGVDKNSTSLYFETVNNYVPLNFIYSFFNKIVIYFSNDISSYINIHFALFTFIPFIILYLLYIKYFKSEYIILFLIIVLFSSFNLMHFLTGHFTFMVIFLLLWLYFFYKFYINMNLLNSILLGLFFGLSMVFNVYYGYFTLFIYLYSIFYLFFFERKIFKKFLYYLFISLIVSSIIILIYIYPFIDKIIFASNQPEGSEFNRSFDSVTGVLPWMYLFPSQEHFLATEYYSKFYKKIMMIGNVVENSVYLGWFSIIFFFYTLYLFIKKKLSLISHNWYRFIFGATFISFLLSLPPYIPIGEFKIYWISTYLHDIFPMFRIYNRFAIFVLIFVTIGALIGFHYFLQKNSKYSRQIITISAIFIVLELSFKLPTIDLNSYPKVYDWLKKQKGDFLIYEIPEESTHSGKDDFQFYKFLYYQNIHGKKLFNRVPIKVDLQSYDFYEKLKKLKVKYIIQHLNLYKEGYVPKEYKRYVAEKVANEKFNNGIIEKLPKWYKIEKESNNVIVYKIY